MSKHKAPEDGHIVKYEGREWLVIYTPECSKRDGDWFCWLRDVRTGYIRTMTCDQWIAIHKEGK